MPTVKGPDFLALQVRDLETARRFYRDIVGLAEAPQSPPDAVLFQTIPIPFAVRKPHVDLDQVPILGHGVALWFCCDDSVALYHNLKGKGVKVLDEPMPGSFGMTLTFPRSRRLCDYGARQVLMQTQVKEVFHSKRRSASPFHRAA